MFSCGLMVLSKSSDFFGIEVEGWPMKAAPCSDSRKVSRTFPFILPIWDDIFFP